eukprot:359606-Chlamydomonas_euryale.AAC.7
MAVGHGSARRGRRQAAAAFFKGRPRARTCRVEGEKRKRVGPRALAARASAAHAASRASRRRRDASARRTYRVRPAAPRALAGNADIDPEHWSAPRSVDGRRGQPRPAARAAAAPACFSSPRSCAARGQRPRGRRGCRAAPGGAGGDSRGGRQGGLEVRAEWKGSPALSVAAMKKPARRARRRRLPRDARAQP